MAKALFGHVGAVADPLLVAELRGLRRKVDQLESELARVRAANEALMNSVTVDDDIRLLTEEPALT